MLAGSALDGPDPLVRGSIRALQVALILLPVRIVRAVASVQRDSLNPVPVSLGLEWPLLAFWLIMRQLYSVCVVSHKGLFAPDDCTKCTPHDNCTLSECYPIPLSGTLQYQFICTPPDEYVDILSRYEIVANVTPFR